MGLGFDTPLGGKKRDRDDDVLGMDDRNRWSATLTWYICVGVLPWEFLGDGVNGSVAPLFDTARLSGEVPEERRRA